MASKPTRWPCSVVLSHIFSHLNHSLFLLRRAKDEQGWIMDGFPSTVAQAKLLEKALSGYDANAKPSKNKSRQSRLAVDPNPPKDPPPPVSGIDVVILLDVQDQTAMKRAAGRSCKLLYQKYCHGLWTNIRLFDCTPLCEDVTWGLNCQSPTIWIIILHFTIIKKKKLFFTFVFQTIIIMLKTTR